MWIIMKTLVVPEGPDEGTMGVSSDQFETEEAAVSEARRRNRFIVEHPEIYPNEDISQAFWEAHEVPNDFWSQVDTAIRALITRSRHVADL